MLATRFAITATSTTLPAEIVSLIEDMIGSTLHILLVAVVNDVIFGRNDVCPCSIVSVVVVFAEGFTSGSDSVWP